MAYKAMDNLPLCPCSRQSGYASLPTVPHSCQRSDILPPQGLCTCSSLFLEPSSPDTCMTLSLASFRSLLKFPFSVRPSWNPFKIAYSFLPEFPVLFPALFLSGILIH